MVREQNPGGLGERRGKMDTPAPRQFMWRLLSDYLPRMPFWMQQLNGILNAGTIDLARAVEMVSYDNTFCAEFVRICRLGELCSSDDRVDNLIVLLGKERSRAAILGAFLTSYLNNQSAPVLEEFARRIDRLASMTHRLAMSSMEIDAVEAYVAGLVHHAGTLPLLLTIDGCSDLAPAWLDFSLESLTTQWLLFGTDTVELGQAISLLWDYPPAIRESLRFSVDASTDMPTSRLAHIVRAAGQLCAAGLSAHEACFDFSQEQRINHETASRSKILPFIPYDR